MHAVGTSTRTCLYCKVCLAEQVLSLLKSVREPLESRHNYKLVSRKAAIATWQNTAGTRKLPYLQRERYKPPSRRLTKDFSATSQNAAQGKGLVRLTPSIVNRHPQGTSSQLRSTIFKDFRIRHDSHDGSKDLETVPVRVQVFLSPDGNHRYEEAGDVSGRGLPLVIPRIWLRDFCQCQHCIHPVTRQRQLDTFSISPDIKMIDCRFEGTELHVTWNDGHKSLYQLDWLRRSFEKIPPHPDRPEKVAPKWWDEGNIKMHPPEVHYENVMQSTQGVQEWTRNIRLFGFCFVIGCPVSPEATQKLLERIGPIRNTHYGGFYDFTSDMASKDTAYSSIALDVHTDTTYFTDPVGLQMLHLLSHTDGEGGVSQLVDGFRAAHNLWSLDEHLYEALSSVRFMSHASGNDGISIQPQMSSPVLVNDRSSGELVQVRWNNADRAAFDFDAYRQPTYLNRWYEAARVWSNILKLQNADIRYEFQLEPGKALIFDNWRVLHGRTAFTGKRRMCGGYINRDDFISRYKMTNFGQERVLNSCIY